MRYVIARKKHTCKHCYKEIKKDKVCIQGGKRFYHKKCYAELRLLFESRFPEPKMTETVRRKQIFEWGLKELEQATKSEVTKPKCK